MYQYTKERNINELQHNSMYGYENNRNSPVVHQDSPKFSVTVINIFLCIVIYQRNPRLM